MCENFVEAYSFRRVSTKFPHNEITIFCVVKYMRYSNLAASRLCANGYFIVIQFNRLQKPS